MVKGSGIYAILLSHRTALILAVGEPVFGERAVQ
jgi:hypothetical protein